MKPEDFEKKRCNSGKNWQFKPKGFARLDLGKIARAVEEKGAEIELETSSLLILKIEGMQVDINSSGKIVAKTDDPERAEKTFSELVKTFK